MLKRLASSTLAGLITLCFAYGAITWGSMPGCSGSSSQAVPASQDVGNSHQHAPGSDRGPATAQCFVHLCCVQVATPARDLSTQLRIAATERATALVLISQLIPTKSPREAKS